MRHSTITFTVPQFNANFFRALSEFRKTRKFCDIKIRVGNKIIYAHKLVLAAYSSYFEEEFYHRHVKEIDFSNDETNFKIMSAIINFAYTGQIEIPFENLKLLLKNLDSLKMSSNLRHKLKNMKLADLNDDNCIDIFFLSGQLNLGGLKSITAGYISVNLRTVLETDKFIRLDRDQMIKILEEIQFLSDDAASKFEAIMKWVKHDWDDRSKRLEHMLNTFVSKKHLSSAYVEKHILADEVLLKSFDGLKWIFESFLDDYPNDENPFLYAFDDADLVLRQFDIVENTFTEHERPEYDDFGMVKYKSCIYAVGGSVGYSPTDYGWKYHTMAKTWQQFDCDIGRTLCGVTSIEDKLYAIGGCGENGISDFTCSSYDFSTGKLAEICPMMSRREIPGIAVYHSSIYALGGCRAKAPIERFDPREGKWKNVAEINLSGATSAALLGHTVCSLDINDKILQVHDIRNLQFSTLLKIPDAMTVAALKGQFYVGGNFGIRTYDRLSNVLSPCSEYMKCTLLVC